MKNTTHRRVSLALSVITACAAVAFLRSAWAQTDTRRPDATMQNQRIISSMPDLSGDWSADWGEGDVPVQSVSLSDIGARRRGKEGDIPYQEWALRKTMSERPPTGPDGDFENTTDPAINYCEPLGVPRIYTYPARTTFIQTPGAVYILHEVGPN